MIELVSFAKNGNTIAKDIPILYYLPRYVDRSEAIGIEGLYRSYLYNLEKTGIIIVSEESTPRPKSEAQLFEMSIGRDIEYMKEGKSKSLVDHFFDKLVHIALPKEINNPFLESFYQTKQKEMVNFVLEHA